METGSIPNAGVAFAVDFPDLPSARAAVLAVGDAVGMLKIGLELFIHAGPDALHIAHEAGLPAFLDLKLHDIPETVERAVGRASALGARVLTVHASGGSVMLKRAVDRAAKDGGTMDIAAVTVLTSLDGADLATMGVSVGIAAHAERLARMAQDQGVRSFVCSPHEAAALRAALGDEVRLITPGVRSATSGPTRPADDQKRVMTATEAIESGADWVVVGRPIRDASDPRAAAQAIAREVSDAVAARAMRRRT